MPRSPIRIINADEHLPYIKGTIAAGILPGGGYHYSKNGNKTYVRFCCRVKRAHKLSLVAKT